MQAGPRVGARRLGVPEVFWSLGPGSPHLAARSGMLVAGSSPRRALVRAGAPPGGLGSGVAVAAAAPKGQLFSCVPVDQRGPRTSPSQRRSRDGCPAAALP